MIVGKFEFMDEKLIFAPVCGGTDAVFALALSVCDGGTNAFPLLFSSTFFRRRLWASFLSLEKL